jgi:hypothetical protein
VIYVLISKKNSLVSSSQSNHFLHYNLGGLVTHYLPVTRKAIHATPGRSLTRHKFLRQSICEIHCRGEFATTDMFADNPMMIEVPSKQARWGKMSCDIECAKFKKEIKRRMFCIVIRTSWCFGGVKLLFLNLICLFMVFIMEGTVHKKNI